MEVSQRLEKWSHLKVQAKFGASGLLKDEIADGAKTPHPESFLCRQGGAPQTTENKLGRCEIQIRPLRVKTGQYPIFRSSEILES
jgi:hypothetical protein